MTNIVFPGISVIYDLSKPSGQRVARLRARCVKCRVPVMEDVLDEQIYKVATTSFVANGGDSYSIIKDNKIDHHLTGKRLKLFYYVLSWPSERRKVYEYI